MTKPIYEFVWKQNPCHVSLGDLSNEVVDAMIDYCDEYNVELESFDMVDVSDTSGKYDTIATLKFKHEVDALAFRLKFKCK